MIKLKICNVQNHYHHRCQWKKERKNVWWTAIYVIFIRIIPTVIGHCRLHVECGINNSQCHLHCQLHNNIWTHWRRSHAEHIVCVCVVYITQLNIERSNTAHIRLMNIICFIHLSNGLSTTRIQHFFFLLTVAY